MNKQFLQKLDKSETARVSESINSQKAVDADHVKLDRIFRNDQIYEILVNGNNPILGGFNASSLPSVSVFYERILSPVCPRCDCVNQPNLIEPYLERGLVIPILTSMYRHYPTHFVETILRYPHLSFPEFDAYRTTRLRQMESGYYCPHCDRKAIKQFMSMARRVVVKTRLDQILSALLDAEPFLPPERSLVDLMKECILKGDNRGLNEAIFTIHNAAFFRAAEACSAIPQLSLSDKMLRRSPSKPKLNIPQVPFETVDVRDSVLSGLKLAYNPTIPLETYLDIIEPRRRTISHLVRGITAKANPPSREFLSNLQGEIERINVEVREIKASKKAQVLSLLTNFFSQNKEVMGGLLTGAVLGFRELGLIGCASGSLLGSIGTGTLKKFGHIKVPSEAKELEQKIVQRIEPGFEKVLSFYLSKDIRAIQVWQLQRRIKSVN